jgi:hypothetical protein
VPSASSPLFDVIYDRAAFVAISPLKRKEYSQKLAALLRPGGYLFLDTIERPLSTSPITEGPPFSAGLKQISALILDESGLFNTLSYENSKFVGICCRLGVVLVLMWHVLWGGAVGPTEGGTPEAPRVWHQWVLQRTTKPAL